jgi:hypothetical protein
MGGTRNSGGLSNDLRIPLPQYPVAGRRQNHFKLYDFPLVTQMSLLY